MANTIAQCVSCGGFIEAGKSPADFALQRCADCQEARKFYGRFGSLLVKGVMTQRELAEIKREFYSLYKIDKALEQRKVEFMQRANEEMNKVISEVEAQVGRPLKELRDRKAQLEAQLKAYMEESRTADMVVKDLLVELRDTIVNRGNMPQYKQIIEDLRALLKWSEEEMDTFVKAHYSQPVSAPVMTVKPLPPGRRKLKQGPPVPGKPVASRSILGSISGEILKNHERDGGGTFDMNGRNLSGRPLYAVSIYPDRSMPLHRALTERDIDLFIEKNADLLTDPRNKIGTWSNGGTNFLDVVVAIADRNKAVELGKHYNQRAIFDLSKMAEIPTGGTGDPIPDLPEATQRLEPLSIFDEEFSEPTSIEEGGIKAYRVFDLDLPTMATVHADFVKSGKAICKVTTGDDVFILTGTRVRENGLANMIALQKQTKRTLKVADVDNRADGTVHVLVEGQFAYDPNTLRSFLAERIDGYEITDIYVDSPERVAAELKPVDKIATDPMSMAMSFFTQMADTLQNLMMLERRRSETAQALMGQTSTANLGGAFDDGGADELSLKYERGQPAGGQQGSFGDGTRADGGMMGPNDPAGRGQAG